MSDRNIVVSGQKLAVLAASVESTQRPDEAASYPQQLAALLGAPAGAFFTGLESAEAAKPDGPLNDAERAAMIMRFNHAVEMLRDADETPGVFSTTEDQLAALIQSQLADQADRDGKLAPAVDGREAKFDERDVRWALSLVSWVGKLRPHAWRAPPTDPDKAPAGFQLALTGDWGTGLYGAPEFKQHMEDRNDLAYYIHLGDVYYSGTEKESKNNFLRFWPQKPSVVSRACNGNHEMYSGGYGYFDHILPQFGQTSSCFAMQNDDWLLVGLDSAYADHDLAHDQQMWLAKLIGAAPNKQVVLFTHHQPFSHFEGGGEKLVAKLRPLLDAGRIAAWYWGHEHRCVVYDAHPQWKFLGRCIGHSGYPYFRKPGLSFAQAAAPAGAHGTFWRELPAKSAGNVPRAILLDGPNPFLADHRDKYGPNGWLTLEFQGRSLTERYYLATGTLLWEHRAIP